ncbi:MAG: prephenate dehydratase domain-containing protein [Buchnera aphidicola (Eriosoma harunire)]
MKSINSILQLRTNINKIDKKIINLIKNRESISIKIAEIKQKKNKPIRDEKREKELLKSIQKLANKKKINIEYITKIFKIIIDNSIYLQKMYIQQINQSSKKKIFYLGPQGSYSHIATLKYIEKYKKNTITSIPCHNFLDVFKKTEKHIHGYAIAPIKNTYSGAIDEICHILKKTKLFITKKINIEINHCLLALPNTSIKNINTLYTHPQPLIQCNKFINTFRHWKIKYKNSTADAMQYIKLNKQHNAATLGDKNSGKLYNLTVLKKNISNKKHNITHFIVLKKTMNYYNNNNNIVTGLLVTIIKKNDNLKKISYIFNKYNFKINDFILCANDNKNSLEIIYIEVLYNLYLVNTKNLFSSLQQIVKSMKILGYYPNNNK